MLSIEDILREIGKNIFICPFYPKNIRDNSIDLTASKFAWTTDGEYIYDDQTKKITVPPRKTACIVTNESIYVRNNIGGTYHSRVSLARDGFGHIGTMLDPKYCGQSFIVLHNISDHPISIKRDDRIVSLVFYYLSTPIVDAVLPTPPSHLEKIAILDKDNKYRDWSEKNNWINNPKLLIEHFKKYYQKDLLEKREALTQKKSIINRLWSSKGGRYVLKYLLFLLIVSLVASFIAHFLSPLEKSNWVSFIASGTTVFIGLIIEDITKKD